MARGRRIQISKNHRRAIASTLGLLDEMLCRFERWMHQGPGEGVLFRELDSLTDAQRSAIQSEIDALRKVLVELHDDLNLEVRTQNIAKAIWSQTSAFWETLVELETKHLRRYGDIPEGFAEYFDHQIGSMIEHMRRIGDMASGSSVRRGRASGPRRRY